MRRHEVRHEELLHAQLPVDLLVALREALVHQVARLAHHRQHGVRHVLGRHLQLAAHVVGAQLVQERVAVLAVGQHVVEPDARAHEHLLHARQLAQPAQQTQVVGVVGPQLLAGLGVQAALVRARARFQLLGAGRRAEVRRGAAHVVDVALEVGLLDDGPRLLHQRVVAARLHDAPLMEGERAERALAEAAAVAGQAELHLADGGHAASRLVHRVVRARVRQSVHGVHLALRKRRGGRVLHDELVVGIRLHEALASEGIAVLVLHGEAARVLQLVILHGGKRRQRHRVVHVLERRGAVHRAVDEREVLDGQPRVQRVGDLDDGMLPHAVRHEVGPRIQQDGALQLVRPVVVVRKPPQAGLDAAQNERSLLERAPDQVAVHHGSVVRTPARLTARRVRVAASTLLRHRVVVHHRVHVAGRYEEGQPRFAEHGDAFRIVPIGLRDDAHLVAVRLQQTRDDGHAERRMIDVGVARHVYEIDPIPAAFEHLLARYRQKRRFHGTNPPV